MPNENAIQWFSDEDFRSAMKAADGKPLADVGIRKAFGFEVKAEGVDKPVQMVISCEDPDRYGDTVAVSGWDLKAFQANPVVLFGHDKRALPIGRASKVWTDGKYLKAEIEWAPADVNPMGPQVEAAVRKRFLNAASVGMRLLEYGPRKDESSGYALAITKQELVEFSIVTVPAHAQALVTQRGLDDTAERAPAVDANAERLDKVERALASLVESSAALAARVKANEESATKAVLVSIGASPAATATYQPDPQRIADEIATAMKASGADLAELIGR